MRTALSRLLLAALLGVGIFAAIRLGSGPSGSIVALDGVKADRLEHRAFELDAPGRFAIDASGSFEEAGTEASDTTMAAYGWIVRRADGAVVWRMRPPRPARGTLAAVRDTIPLQPGVYDAYFTSYGDPLVRAPGPRDRSLREQIRAALSRGGRAWVGDAGRWRLLVSGLDAGARAARPRGDEGALGGDAAVADEADSALVWRAQGVRNHERRERLVQVTAPARVRVRALTEATDGVVADRASIVRLGPRDTVWTLGAEPSTWAGGSLKNRLVVGEVDLAPGLYRIAYEADRSHAYGGWEANPPFTPWAWGMAVRSLSPAGAIVPLDPATLDRPRIAGFECVGPDEEREETFTLRTPTDVMLVAVGEVTGGSRYDYGALDRVDGDDVDEVWEMGREGLEAAGGSDKNRRAVAVLSLEPGTYRLRYETDGSHDCVSGYNSGGGPDAPLWGAVLYALDPDFDLGTVERPAPPTAAPGREPTGPVLARIDSVGNNVRRVEAFELSDPGEVFVVAAGEISSSDRYDYARILDATGAPVWEMTWANTVAGGGSTLNRRFEGTLSLQAGRYTVHYVSDGSRSFGDTSDGPDDPTLWGVRVYLIEAGSWAPEAPDVPEAPSPPAPPPPAPSPVEV